MRETSMLRELLAIFRGDDPLGAMGRDFQKMLDITYGMVQVAGRFFFDKQGTPEERTHLYKQDVEVNKLERSIRKQVATRLGISGHKYEVPYCLGLMSLVKDAERLGDYAKNLSEVMDVDPSPLPDDEIARELQEIRREIERKFKTTAEVFARSDRNTAAALLREGLDMARRCDTLVARVAKSQHNAATATSLVLGIRYYKRIGGHLQNILSAVVMPLHKLDYYDEDEITNAGP